MNMKNAFAIAMIAGLVVASANKSFAGDENGTAPKSEHTGKESCKGNDGCSAKKKAAAHKDAANGHQAAAKAHQDAADAANKKANDAATGGTTNP